MNLPFIVGEIGEVTKDEDGKIISGSGLAFHNIDCTGCRKSIDGTKAIQHMNLLSVEQLNSIRGDMAIRFYDVDEMNELMATEEWTVVSND